jgi:selenoprotein W-related protein
VRAAHDLLANHQNDIETLTLITGSKGIFDVVVDGAVIYSKHAEGRHAEPGEVLDRYDAKFG